MTKKQKILKKKNKDRYINDHEKLVYLYHSIVGQQTYIIPRLVAKLLRFNWFKRLFFSTPLIDESVLLKNGNGEHTIYGEYDMSMIGVFKNNWDINTWLLDQLYKLPVYFNTIHGVYVPETYRAPKLWFKRLVLDITEFNKITQKALLNHIKVSKIFGKDGSKKVIVFHPVPLSLNKSENDIIKGIHKNLKPLLSRLEDNNIYIGIENMPYLRAPRTQYFPLLGRASFFEKLMNEINHPNIGITFDWGHANSFARFMYENNIKEGSFEFTPETLAHFEYQNYFIKKLHNKIVHLHIHYNCAHKINKKPPKFLFTNFDSHRDLTMMDYFEYENYKKNVQNIIHSKYLISATLEIVPRAFFPAKSYQSSVKVFEAMIK